MPIEKTRTGSVLGIEISLVHSASHPSQSASPFIRLTTNRLLRAASLLTAWNGYYQDDLNTSYPVKDLFAGSGIHYTPEVALHICEIRITISRPSYPYRWKCTQVVPTEPKTIGDRLKKHRLMLHLFQADLAREFGVTVDSIRNWEHNLYPPSEHHISRILNWISKTSPETKDK
jgi:DNA-binding transcriptional regulator YiaG